MPPVATHAFWYCPLKWALSVAPSPAVAYRTEADLTQNQTWKKFVNQGLTAAHATLGLLCEQEWPAGLPQSFQTIHQLIANE